MKFQKMLIIVIGIYSGLDAFEVNTHQALTRCAITSGCDNGYAKSLESFVNHGKISTQSYKKEVFEYYGDSYANYVKDGLGFKEWKIRLQNPNYLGMIEAGSVLEDAVYPVHDHDGDGWLHNYFYVINQYTYLPKRKIA